MKTQQECWEALIAGRQLHSNADSLLRLHNGFIEQFLDGDWHKERGWTFDNPEHWSIYEPPKPKVVRWLWAYDGSITTFFYTERELGEHRVNSHVKLEWSRTEFDV